MSAPDTVRMTYAEYLAAEEASEIKHEYLRGEVYAMAGGSLEHAALGAALTIELGRVLGDRPRRVFNSDLRVRVEATDLTTYPDVTLIRGPPARSELDPNAATNPILIVEVLSDSTEAYDRGEKFAHYRRLPSLREYLLVSQHKPRLEVYRKNEAGDWILSEAGEGERLRIACLDGAELEVDRVYRDPLAGGESRVAPR